MACLDPERLVVDCCLWPEKAYLMIAGYRLQAYQRTQVVSKDVAGELEAVLSTLESKIAIEQWSVKLALGCLLH